jgi:hypothetical protein
MFNLQGKVQAVADIVDGVVSWYCCRKSHERVPGVKGIGYRCEGGWKHYFQQRVTFIVS